MAANGPAFVGPAPLFRFQPEANSPRPDRSSSLCRHGEDLSNNGFDGIEGRRCCAPPHALENVKHLYS